MNTYLTSHTLLSRALRDQDGQAWDVFSQRYRGYIIKLLYNLGIRKDQEDITQEVMLTLWKKLETYDRERSKFRTWLSSVVRLTAMNSLRKRNRQEKLVSSSSDEMLDNFPDEQAYMDFAEDEWKKFIAQKALENLKQEFKGHAIEVFELSLQGTKAEEIGERLNLSTSSVYTLKKRVKKRLMQEVYFLQKDLDHA